MSVFPKPSELFGVYYGFLVTGGAKTLPASTKQSIFTVGGGRVIVTSLHSVVSTVIQAQACTLSVGNTPTVGSAAAASIAAASASLSGLAVGQYLAVPPFTNATTPAALVLSGTSGVMIGNGSTSAIGVPVSSGGICIVPAGTIDVTTSATNTGAIVYSITYVPYDVGATITAL
jgi:hypothetical protein